MPFIQARGPHDVHQRFEGLLAICKEYLEYKTVLHSDQGSVYVSQVFDELLPMYGVTRFMWREGTPTDNAEMKTINGWIKAEMFMDFM